MRRVGALLAFVVSMAAFDAAAFAAGEAGASKTLAAGAGAVAVEAGVPLAASVRPKDATLDDHAAAGLASFRSGAFEAAVDAFQAALEARGPESRLVRAWLGNYLALAWEALGAVDEAREQLRASLGEARAASGTAAAYVRIQAATNLARLALHQGVEARVTARLASLAERVRALPSSSARTTLLLSLGDLHRRAFLQFALDGVYRDRAYALFRLAERDARDEPLSHAYALGNLARLYAADEQPEAALGLARQAIFQAQQARANESLYQWEWLIARQHRAAGRTALALEYYRQARATLETVRAALIRDDPFTFAQRIEPLYRELTDLRLARTARMQPGPERQRALRAVQRLLEDTNAAEVQDYFRHQCALPEQAAGAIRAERDAAVVYPILLESRTEILVVAAGKIHQFTTRYGRAAITEAAHALRRTIQGYGSDDALRPLAQRLYTALFRPQAALLERLQIETLIYVPRGPLRTVPAAAFHDGERYLVERYAIATTLGLSLTEQGAAARAGSQILAGGLAVARQGMNPLPEVNRELSALQSDFGAKRVQDAQFTLNALRDDLASRAYGVVHIATHGHFDSNARDSYLLTYDDRLTLAQLEAAVQARHGSAGRLDLLVLSACETAMGDARAALGLAGVALKAGADSAIASLWKISDTATYELMRRFYAGVYAQGLTKAAALRRAQRALIATSRFDHPYDWAPYLLVGQWR